MLRILNLNVVVFIVRALALTAISMQATSQPVPELKCKDIFSNFKIAGIITNLANLKLKLEQAKIQGSTSLAFTALNFDYDIEIQKLVNYLEINNLMTKNELQHKIKLAVAKISNEEDKNTHHNRINKVLNPVNLSRKIVFNKISPGKFKMGPSQFRTKITKSFEVTDTPITQMTWARLKIAMGENDLNKINPSHFKSGVESLVVKFKDIEVQMLPDHPVESVSWHDTNEFIIALNNLSKSEDIATQKILLDIIPNHQKDDVYDLPTEAQWEFIMSNRGNSTKKYFDHNDPSDLLNYAWLLQNSDYQTHPVATKLPRIVDDKPFYDLEGNVMIWTKDWHYYEMNSWKRNTSWLYNKIIGQTDPQGQTSAKNLFLKVIRGSCYTSRIDNTLSISSISNGNDARFSSVGFRLVRTKP